MAGAAYRGVPLFGAVRIPLDAVFKSRYLEGPRLRWRTRLRWALWSVREIARMAVTRLRRRRSRISADRAVVLVVDHDVPAFCDMQYAVARACAPQPVVVVSIDPVLSETLSSRGLPVVGTQSLEAGEPLKAGHLSTAWRLWMGLPELRRQGIGFALQWLVFLLRALARIDAYRRLVTADHVAAVVVLSDVHAHEYTIVSIARLAGVRSATLQHGIVNHADTPVTADTICVWGASTRETLRALNVDDARMAVTGRPAFDEEVERLEGSREAVRGEWRRRYRLPDGPIVAYFATNFGPEENQLLFDCFAASHASPVAHYVKLKRPPAIGPAVRQQYERWIAEKMPTRPVPIVTDEGLADCFAVADVVVTFHSSAGVEALAFGTIVVLLDLFPHINLRSLVYHYDDAVVVRSAEELRAFLDRLADPEFLAAQRARARRAGERHFARRTHRTAAQRIADIVLGRSPVLALA